MGFSHLLACGRGMNKRKVIRRKPPVRLLVCRWQLLNKSIVVDTGTTHHEVGCNACRLKKLDPPCSGPVKYLRAEG